MEGRKDMVQMAINDLTGVVVDTALKIHSSVGPGCFERVYEEILYYELVQKKILVNRQVLLPINYKDLYISDAYKLDLLIDNRVIVEIKSVEHIAPVHFKQVMTYLKLSNLKNGMLLNFRVERMKDGIYRVFNNFGV